MKCAALVLLSWTLCLATEGLAETSRLVTVTCRPEFKKESIWRAGPQLDIRGTPAKTPEIDPDNCNVSLVLRIDGREALIDWEYARDGKTHVMFEGVKLQADKDYTFVVEEVTTTPAEIDPRCASANDAKVRSIPIYLYSLASITLGGQTVFDRSVCEVHHIPMQRRVMRICYGEPALDYSIEVLKSTFPHYRDHILGGCVVMDRTHDKAFICLDCVKAYTKWKAAHPDPK